MPRPRLVEAVSEGLLRGLGLVCAPAGFGKTALLAEWARAGGRPVAWLGREPGRTGSVIEIQALQALALAARGDHRAALDALAKALTLARPQGHVRVFADEDAPMRALLRAAQREQSPARVIPGDYLARLGHTSGLAHAEPPGRAAGAAPGLVEPLTVRETAVLRLIAAGKSNQRIAHELVVTLDTVKKHVSHVLGKLGAANRTQAVSRARDLGVIP